MSQTRDRVLFVLAAVCAVLLVVDFYKIFMILPDEANQGAIYRIVYVHVPSIFTGFTGFFVALAASGMYLATGKLKWHYQATPHDEWDWDAVQPLVLIDAPLVRGWDRLAPGLLSPCDERTMNGARILTSFRRTRPPRRPAH